MTDSHGKRKYAGPTPAERRKTGTDAVIEVRKLPPHKHPRDYVLVTVETRTTVTRNETRYKTKAHMDAAKVAIRKKQEDHSARRNKYFKWRDETTTYKLEFEETLQDSTSDASAKPDICGCDGTAHSHDHQ
jgi:hypothetical protein